MSADVCLGRDAKGGKIECLHGSPVENPPDLIVGVIEPGLSPTSLIDHRRLPAPNMYES